MKKSLIVISAPSGSGKTTICRMLQKTYPNWKFSVSLTTRQKRSYEKDGYDYRFISEKEFRRKVERGELLEYEEVHGHFYGTPRENIESVLGTGETLLLELDVKGGLAVKNAYPEDIITVFIRPPSIEELKRRLRGRGSDTETAIERRLERMRMEMAFENLYDYSVVNEDVETTVEEIVHILEAQESEMEEVRNGS